MSAQPHTRSVERSSKRSEERSNNSSSRRSGEHSGERSDVQSIGWFAHLLSLIPSSPFGRIVSVLVSAFLAFCTTVGTIYRTDGGSISDFDFPHWLLFLAVFIAYELCIFLLTAWVRSRQRAHLSASTRTRWAAWVRRRTATFRSLWIFFLLAMIWVPLFITLLAGADLINQGAEVNNWLCATVLHGNHCTLLEMEYPPADQYPISRYLWPSLHATFLTNQHNLFLTLFVGLIRFASHQLFQVVWPADLLLCALSYTFATFTLAALASRLLRLHPSMGTTGRSILLLLPILSPIVSFDTVSLTKSPQFAFAFAWWFSTLALVIKKPETVTRRDQWALALSTLCCVICVKYALPIIVIELVVLLIFRLHKAKQWLVCLALPIILFSGALHAAYATGNVVAGDPVESRAVLVQQIARVEKEAPESIPPATQRQLSHIFDTDMMALLYDQNDADVVKSSGKNATTYKWLTITKKQWKEFIPAWASVVKANPRVAFDALAAEFYGYFDLADPPYVSFLFYADNAAVGGELGAKWAFNPVRLALIHFFRGWASIPVIGWPLHGNFWVVATLLVVCVQLRIRRWEDLLLALPLLAQMGVMALAPANNFDRHMIAFAVVFVFCALDLFADKADETADEVAVTPSASHRASRSSDR